MTKTARWAHYNRKYLISFAWIFAFFAGESRAEDVEGLVRVVGSAIDSSVILSPDKGYKGPALCKGEDMKRVGRLSGMTVKVTGEWQFKKDGSKKCVKVSSFTVTKTSSGRDAVVGTITQKNGKFIVDSEDGKTRDLTDVPAGLRKFEGQKVIIDLKPMEGLSGHDAAFKVVSYSAFP